MPPFKFDRLIPPTKIPMMEQGPSSEIKAALVPDVPAAQSDDVENLVASMLTLPAVTTLDYVVTLHTGPLNYSA
jgi:hypothetical protein